MVYDELGINRVLPEGSSRRDTELMTTLSTYLDHGGGLVATAAELSIHRSTLRYRLHRIAELSMEEGVRDRGAHEGAGDAGKQGSGDHPAHSHAGPRLPPLRARSIVPGWRPRT